LSRAYPGVDKNGFIKLYVYSSSLIKNYSSGSTPEIVIVGGDGLDVTVMKIPSNIPELPLGKDMEPTY